MSRFKEINLRNRNIKRSLLSFGKIAIMVIMIFGFIANGACIFPINPIVLFENSIRVISGLSRTFEARIEDQTSTSVHGDVISLELYAESVKTSAYNLIDYTFIPVSGATNFSFSGEQPTNSQPPFIWEDIPVISQGKSASTTVTFELPSLPDGQSGVSSFIVSDSSDGQTLAYSIHVANNGTTTSLSNQEITSQEEGIQARRCNCGWHL